MDVSPRDVAPREFGPRELAPREVVPREVVPRELAPREVARLPARLLARLRAPRRGVATLEFAVVASLVLIPLLIGCVDYGIVMLDYARATRAQQAALMAALDGASNGAIQNAAQAAFGTGSSTTTVNTSWYCAPSAQSWTHTGTAYGAPPDCGPGYLATQYISVLVEATQTLPIPLPGYTSAFPIQTSTMVRIQ